MYTNGIPHYRVNMPNDELGWSLQVPYVTQPTTLTSNTAWFAVHLVSKYPAYFFTPSQLTFLERSSDGSNDSLGKTNTFSDPTYIYTSAGMGVVWQGTPRLSDTLVTSGYWDQTPVNEFIFVGAMSEYFVYSDPASYAEIGSYILGWTDMSITGTWQFDDGDGDVFSVRKTLHTYGTYTPGIAGIDGGGAGTVSVGSDVGQNDSWILQSASSNIASPTWTDVATVNSNDTNFFPSLAPANFWRLKLQ